MMASFYLHIWIGMMISYGTDSTVPVDYFRPPIDHEIRLSGTFGELRPGHFHSGIDIKSSTGGIGDPVLAAAEGYVERILVSGSGYGRALYVRHPNGYSTVYAHLDNFGSGLEKYIRQEQYRLKRSELNLYPPAGRFPVKKGEQIGMMGNSGSSFAPHLHFEIRRSASQKPMNPLLFGLRVEDKISPAVIQMKIDALTPDSETLFHETYRLSRQSGIYKPPRDTLTIPSWRCGVAIETFDRSNGAPNRNGVYRIKMFVDDSLHYDFKVDEFAFSESRYLNAHVDFEMLQKEKAYLHRCYQLPGNQFSMYESNTKFIPLYRDKIQAVRLEVFDIFDNRSDVRFWLRRAEDVQVPDNKVFDFKVDYLFARKIDEGDFQLQIPARTFYRNTYLQWSRIPERSAGYWSQVYRIGEKHIPAHRYFQLSLTPDSLNSQLMNKYLVASCDEDGNYLTYGGVWRDGMLEISTRNLGDFWIMCDTTAPRIEPVRFSQNMNGWSSFEFEITDNFDPTGRASALAAEARIDDQWIPIDFDRKNDRIQHTFDHNLSPGEHKLTISVTDDRGNKKDFEASFIF